MAQSGLATLFGLRGDDPNSLKVPDAPEVDTTQAQRDAVRGNLKNLGDIERLGTATNDATARQFMAFMEKLVPGFSSISGKIAENIKSQVSGQLPADVRRMLSRTAAEKGIARGTSGSEFEDYGELRDLGLTSLQITNKGLDTMTRWMQAINSSAPTFNSSSMFVTPAQRIATEQWNEVNRYNTQFLKNQISMLPSNAEMAGAQILDYVATWATTAASYGTSSAMGGGGGQSGFDGYNQFVGGNQQVGQMPAYQSYPSMADSYDFNGVGQNVGGYA
jgi:hypothetical protein